MRKRLVCENGFRARTLLCARTELVWERVHLQKRVFLRERLHVRERLNVKRCENTCSCENAYRCENTSLCENVTFARKACEKTTRVRSWCENLWIEEERASSCENTLLEPFKHARTLQIQLCENPSSSGATSFQTIVRKPFKPCENPSETRNQRLFHQKSPKSSI